MSLVVTYNNNEMEQETKNLEQTDTLRTQYMRLFDNLAMVNWLRGMTRGAAWYNALMQIHAFLSGKNPYNPVIKSLCEIFATHRPEQSRHIMLDKNRDEVCDIDPDARHQININATKNIYDALNKINSEIDKSVAHNNAKLNRNTQRAMIQWHIANARKNTHTKQH